LFFKKRVFDPNPEIKVLQKCFYTYHRVGEDEINPLVKLWRITDVLHARTRQHVPKSRLPTRTDEPHAPSSLDNVQLNQVDPPRPQPVSRHSSNPAQSLATSSDQSSPTSAHATPAIIPHGCDMSSMVGPVGLRVCHVIILRFDPVPRRHYFI
jgi:hypothetical protein